MQQLFINKYIPKSQILSFCRFNIRFLNNDSVFLQSQLPNFIVYEFSCKCVYICWTISCISKEHQKRLYKTLQRTLHMCHWKIWHEAFGECLVQPIKRSADRDKSCTELGLQHKPMILISFSPGPQYPLLGRYRSLISRTLEALILIFILFGGDGNISFWN